jgi:hypothetical protein
MFHREVGGYLMRVVLRVLPALIAAVLFLMPSSAYAQNGSISGQARDASGAALPGVTVEVTGPQLIGTRSTVTDDNGRYQITALPAGTYKITFTLQGFATTTRDNVSVTTDFAANVVADMKVGDIKEVVDVTAEAPTVDVQNARQQLSFAGEELRDLPTSRNVPSLLNLVPGISNQGAFGNFLQGICSGGVGVFCSPVLTNFNSHTSVNDLDGLNQGRLLVNGIPINSANPSLITGQSSGYNADIANAQEITFTLSGSLGESETGGAAINIIPRTGGNRYAGNFFTSYTSLPWFDRNNGSRRGAQPALELNDHDVSGSFGGPIIKDRLWFYSVARHQGKESSQTGGPFYRNLNEGLWGANYAPDIDNGPLTYTNTYRNVNARLTFQATQKNKFDVFWDEQDTCQDPCGGVVSVYTSPESWWSVQTWPNHLAQLNWTNPLTNKLLLEAGVSGMMQHYDTSKHREYVNPRGIPRVAECQTDGTKRINAFAGICPGFDLTSGSITGGEVRNLDSWRSNFAASYITGSHNAKIGYNGALFSEQNYQDRNDPRLSFAYNTNQVATCTGTSNTNCVRPQCSATVTTNCFPVGTTTAADRAFLYCSNMNGTNGNPANAYDVTWTSTVVANNVTQVNPYPCGNNSMYFPQDVANATLRIPTPTSFTMYTGPVTRDEEVQTHAVYVQDQWTLNRFTLSGALRYDNASSTYNPSCIERDVFVAEGYCAPREKTDGVNFHNITPRWGVAWDMFGTGKTSLKWNMGKYVAAASIGGIYTQSNPARRVTNTLNRSWQDWNGNRYPDCYTQNSQGVPNLAVGTSTNGGTNQDPNTPNWARPHSDLGDYCGPAGATGSLSFATDPYILDASGLNAGFFTTTQCGRQSEAGVSPQVRAYCDASGQNLLSGWNKRREEWQLGIGIQHELLPRLSAEVTYNRRWYSNQQVSDTLNNGCELFGDPEALGDRYGQACIDRSVFDQISPLVDYYSLVAPTDAELLSTLGVSANLPGGGGYLITGLTDRKPGVTVGNLQAVTLTTNQVQVWRGVDTNFVLRARGGLRISGGTSTGSQYTDNCRIQVDSPQTASRHGGDMACKIARPFQTNVRANASYTIPFVDILSSVVFQYRPGVERSANYTFFTNQAIWNDTNAYRADNNTGCFGGTATLGCFTQSGTTVTTNLLNAGELYGEGIRLMDLKFAKNIRFAGKRLNVGVDIYNLFNSDAALGYESQINSIVNGVSQAATVNLVPGDATTAVRSFGTVNTITSPRFARFQVQFDF